MTVPVVLAGFVFAEPVDPPTGVTALPTAQRQVTVSWTDNAAADDVGIVRYTAFPTISETVIVAGGTETYVFDDLPDASTQLFILYCTAAGVISDLVSVQSYVYGAPSHDILIRQLRLR